MKLHTNKKVFATAIETTNQELGIYPEFIEKDYWICQILQRLSRHPASELTVWKGGTSLSKAYGLINRFSSDVDFAILGKGLSQNQQKKLVARIGHESTVDLTEDESAAGTIKNNRFRKTYHIYRSVLADHNSRLDLLGNHVIVEINTYGNPHPYLRRAIKPFITEMMERRGLHDAIEEWDMQPFELNVLDKCRTLCEKVVSLLRFSFEDDPIAGLTSKIRHFYDIHYLLSDAECREYLMTSFKDDLLELVAHDKREFDKPAKWRDAPIPASSLISDFGATWQKIAPTYLSELDVLSYRPIPPANAIAASLQTILAIVKELYQSS